MAAAAAVGALLVGGVGYDAQPAAAHGDSTTPGPTPMTGQESHDGHDAHDMTGHDHGTSSGSTDDHGTGTSTTHDHGTGPGTGTTHDHGTGTSDTVTPSTRRLVLSGFAGVNVAVLLYAFLSRRTRGVPRRPRQAR